MTKDVQPLLPGQFKTLMVSAEHKWNPARILFEEGSTYRLEILWVPHWKDGCIDDIDPTQGFTRWYLSPFRWSRRYPSAPWFVLIGAVGYSAKHFFPINQSPLEYTAMATGEFACFVNDSLFAYGNNEGTLDLKITRL